MRRIDDLLIVKELDAKFFDHAIREDLLHTAICTPSAGMEYDYERLELLGMPCGCVMLTDTDFTQAMLF